MPVFRFSLRWLLAFVAFAGISIISLKYASYPNCSCWWGAWLFFLATTVVGAIYRAGQQRAFWLGCCVFGWTFAVHAYLLEGKNSPLDRTIQSAYNAVSWSVPVGAAAAQRHMARGGSATSGINPAIANAFFPLEQPFKSILVVLGGIALAIMGGLVAQWFHATQARKPGDARCGSDDW